MSKSRRLTEQEIQDSCNASMLYRQSETALLRGVPVKVVQEADRIYFSELNGAGANVTKPRARKFKFHTRYRRADKMREAIYAAANAHPKEAYKADPAVSRELDELCVQRKVAQLRGIPLKIVQRADRAYGKAFNEFPVTADTKFDRYQYAWAACNAVYESASY